MASLGDGLICLLRSIPNYLTTHPPIIHLSTFLISMLHYTIQKSRLLGFQSVVQVVELSWVGVCVSQFISGSV